MSVASIHILHHHSHPPSQCLAQFYEPERLRECDDICLWLRRRRQKLYFERHSAATLPEPGKRATGL